MSTKVRESLKEARSHAKALGKHLSSTLDEHINADDTATEKHIRRALRALDDLFAAHDRRERAVGNGIDPEINPTGAMGAQVSDGYEDRAVTAEDIRQREQRAAVDYCYEARMRAEGRRR